jgi:hypothetical protein
MRWGEQPFICLAGPPEGVEVYLTYSNGRGERSRAAANPLVGDLDSYMGVTAWTTQDAINLRNEPFR